MTGTRLVRAACAVVVIVLLAACARIPLSGSVAEGQDVQAPDEQGVQYLPPSPVPGAAPEQIVEGFLEAGTGTQNNYATARSYLTEDVAGSWDPAARVLVRDADVAYTLVGESTVRVEFNVVAEIDQHGVYEAYSTPQPTSIEYQVQRVDGEWRVSSAEPGLVLMTQPFGQVFEPYTVYFYDSTFRYLVPDVRWYPSSSAAATQIVQAILDGPSPWLAEGSVRSAFPDDTELRGPVTTEDSEAVADFTTAISSAASDVFPLMLMQLSESLTDVGGISEV
ncbi:MAG: GerMN domain-containing protein, partial [Pseudoclavibacter sp.]